jgi:pimeloyl-ACP methyl ester carboxylesterase
VRQAGTLGHAWGLRDPEAVSFVGLDAVTLRGDRWIGSDWESLPDVLMFPGGGQTRHSWKATGSGLAGVGFRVTSMDTRGHGESDFAPNGDYSLRVLAGDASAVIEAIGRPVVFVGASLGGLTGILVAPDVGPAKVSALVLVDVVPQCEEKGSDRIRSFLRSGLAGFASLEEAGAAVAAYLPHRPKARSYDGLKRNLRRGADGRWYWHWDPEFVERQPSEDPAERLARLEEAASRINIPVLLLRGRLSDVISDEGVERFVRLVPHVQVVELERAAHTAAGDDNDAFAAAVVNFVRGLCRDRRR